MEFEVNLTSKQVSFLAHLLDYEQYVQARDYDDAFKMVLSVGLDSDDRFFLDGEVRLLCQDSEIEVSKNYTVEHEALRQIAKDWIWDHVEFIFHANQNAREQMKQEQYFKAWKE